MSTPPQSDPPIRAKPLSEVVWEMAFESCAQAFLILLFGHIALSIVGGILEDMIPTPPPGWSGPTHAGSQFSANGASDDWMLNWPYVLTLGAVILAIRWWKRGRAPQAAAEQMPTRGQKVLKRLTEDWFVLIVSNAFGAMISAWLVVWVQEFAGWRFVWGWLIDAVLSHLKPAVEAVLGTPALRQIGQLGEWYGENQVRFTFWALYVAAICDDLGLPNLKTLGRWLGRRFRNRRATATRSGSTVRLG